MTLRFIDFNTSEPQNFEEQIRFAQLKLVGDAHPTRKN
jgi:hypothetical protein